MEMAEAAPQESAPQELALPVELVNKELRFVKVFYGTNRVRESGCADDTSRWDDPPGCRPGEFYGVDAADTQGASAGEFGLDVGTFTVTFPADHRKTKIERPMSIFGYDLRGEDPSRDVVISELRSYSSDYQGWLDDLKGSGRRQAFIYVHGFANSFPMAARRAAQVAYDLDFDVEPDFQGLTMMFSWPSRGSVSPTAYTSDYDASDQAVEAFNRFLDLVTSKHAGLERVHVIAHSMGNRLVANALSARAARVSDSDDRIIDELVLAAPDIPATTFKTRFLRTLPSFAERVTLYVSDKDVALYASSQARSQEARAGQVDGGMLDVDVDRLDVIDASSLETDFLSHDYYASNNSMLSDIYSLLKRIPADQRPLIRPAGPSFRFVTGEAVASGGVTDSRRWSQWAVWAGAAAAVILMGWALLARGRGARDS
jgi:esterase/lipase superfamily enzyme